MQCKPQDARHDDRSSTDRFFLAQVVYASGKRACRINGPPCRDVLSCLSPLLHSTRWGPTPASSKTWTQIPHVGLDSRKDWAPEIDKRVLPFIPARRRDSVRVKQAALSRSLSQTYRMRILSAAPGSVMQYLRNACLPVTASSTVCRPSRSGDVAPFEAAPRYTARMQSDHIASSQLDHRRADKVASLREDERCDHAVWQEMTVTKRAARRCESRGHFAKG